REFEPGDERNPALAGKKQRVRHPSLGERVDREVGDAEDGVGQRYHAQARETARPRRGVGSPEGAYGKPAHARTRTRSQYRPAAATSPPTAYSTAATISGRRDRKSTRLNSSHVSISYAVF